MNWTVTTPTSLQLLTWDDLSMHLRIAQGSDEQFYVMDLLKAAIAYAETEMEMSLLDQTITATFYAGDELFLPRGPIIAVVSATDSQVNSVPFNVSHTGHRTYLWPKSLAGYPLTVVYRAGYASADQVPADIVNAIRVHVGTMYQHRESTSERTVNDVHRLNEFYRFRSRTSPVR